MRCAFGYIMFPYLPWVVEENGFELCPSDKDNWKDSDVYLGQLKYSNKLILNLVKGILTNDPESVIILLSDHGYRQPGHLLKLYGMQHENPELEEFYSKNILNAFYLGGRKLDIEGRSGINAVRMVFDEMFSLNLGLIREAYE